MLHCMHLKEVQLAQCQAPLSLPGTGLLFEVPWRSFETAGGYSGVQRVLLLQPGQDAVMWCQEPRQRAMTGGAGREHQKPARNSQDHF